MNHASLFSGIGGAEVAASMMGWQNLFHCEIQKFPRKVLQYWFPNSESYEDITKTDFTKWHGKVDVLTGGFPCQPFSLAGRRKGADDNRYLWPQMLRAIRQIHPTWVVGENVNGIKTMVESCQVTQMGRTDYLFEENYLYREESRFTLDKICADLEAEGYSVQPIVIPACSVGAPHRRDRVWIVARRISTTPSNPNSSNDNRRSEEIQGKSQKERLSERNDIRKPGFTSDVLGHIAHTQCDGHSPQGHGNQRARAKKSKEGQDRPQSRSRRHGSGKTSTYTLQHRSHQVHQDHQSQFPDGARSNSLSGQWSSSHSYGNGGKTLQPSEGTERTGCKRDVQPKEWSTSSEWADRLSRLQRHDAHAISERLEGMYQSWGEESERKCVWRDFARHCEEGHWKHFPTQSPVCRGNDGIPFDVDSLTISFPKWRQESIKAYGNAWVPQVAYEIFRAIEAEEENNKQ
jgi:DNA (cytosine-5)-methyltransferase 1